MCIRDRGDDGYGYVSYEYILTEAQGSAYYIYGQVYPPPIPGDCNRDGDVDFDDLLVVRNHFGAAGSWEDGDFDADGIVDMDDLFSLRNNFGLTGGTEVSDPDTFGLETPHTPEPSTMALLVLGAAMTLRRRR